MLISRLFKELKVPLFINATYILFVNLLPGIISIIFWIVVSRLYNATEVGLGSAILSVSILISSFAGLGINYGVIRFLGSYRDPIYFINSVATLVSILSVFFGLVFLLGLPVTNPELKILNTSPAHILLFLIFIVVATLSSILVSVFIAQQTPQYSFIFTLISNMLKLVFVIFLFRYGAMGIVGSITLSYISALLISISIFLRISVQEYKFKFVVDFDQYKIVLPYSITNLISQFVQQSVQTVIPLMIISILGPVQNAFAYIPLMLSVSIPVAGFSLATSALAESSTKEANSNYYLTRSTIVGVGITLLISLFIFLLAPFILNLFGQLYVLNSTGLFRMSVLASPFMVFNQNYFTRLCVEQKLKQLLYLNIFGLVTVLGITYYLMPRIGIQASGIGLLLGNGMLSIYIGGKLLRPILGAVSEKGF